MNECLKKYLIKEWQDINFDQDFTDTEIKWTMNTDGQATAG